MHQSMTTQLFEPAQNPDGEHKNIAWLYPEPYPTFWQRKG